MTGGTVLAPMDPAGSAPEAPYDIYSGNQILERRVNCEGSLAHPHQAHVSSSSDHLAREEEGT